MEDSPVCNDFSDVAAQAVKELESLRTSIVPIMRSADLHVGWSGHRLNHFLKQHASSKGIEGDLETFQVEPEHFQAASRLEQDYHNAKIARELLPESLLVTLVSRFDAFLGQLLRTMFNVKPELLTSSEQPLTYSRLIELGSYDSAIEYLVEKEIESVLRKSHVAHFKYIEDKLSIPLRKGLTAWQHFVELTERRNLFVHCDGKVSHQYLARCSDHNAAPTPCPSLGERLEVPHSYFKESCERTCEISVKLAHVVWSNLVPSDRDAIDESINQICFNLISRRRFQLAIILLEFAAGDLGNHHPSRKERNHLTLSINLAQAYKWAGNEDKCLKLLSNEQWDAKSADFQICVDVLRNDFQSVYQRMRSQGDSGVMKADDYRVWPIFQKLRSEKEFQAVYREVFGFPLVTQEESAEDKDPELIEFMKKYLRDGSTIIKVDESTAQSGE